MSAGAVKRSISDRIMRFLNVLILLALITSYAGGQISPEKFWPLAFAAMGYPIILILVALFVLYWALKKHWFVYINLALILFKWDYLMGAVQPPIQPQETGSNSFRLMSYNVRLFDRFNWNKENNTRTEIISLISENQPDILCIQEYYGGKSNEKELFLELKKSGTNYRIHSKNYFAQKKNKRNYGVATITSFPILNEGTIVLENSRDALAIFTDLLIENDTVRVYNIHLQSILLGREGYRVLNELIDNQEIEKVEDGKLMFSRLKSGFLKRAVQAEKIAAHIAACNYSIILAGDFNDVPTSFAVQQLKCNLKDAFSEAGNGLGATYVPVPFFRIDNILVDRNFEVISYKTHNEKALSDHYAISADLSLND